MSAPDEADRQKQFAQHFKLAEGHSIACNCYGNNMDNWPPHCVIGHSGSAGLHLHHTGSFSGPPDLLNFHSVLKSCS